MINVWTAKSFTFMISKNHLFLFKNNFFVKRYLGFMCFDTFKICFPFTNLLKISLFLLILIFYLTLNNYALFTKFKKNCYYF